jgi:hypothetical protein
MDTIYRIFRRHGVLFVTLIAALGALSCQTPTETPPVTQRQVVVQVQDAAGQSIELVPVEMHALEANAAMRLLEARMTDASGNAHFAAEIPTTGRAFRFIVGNQATGMMFVDANLLCRDTVLVVRLATELLPCGETVERLLRIANICAPLRTGERFTDSTQYTFESSCDEALTFTMTGPAATPALHLVVLAPDGSVITARPFTIPPRGRFIVRAVATPADSGVTRTVYTFSGTGPNSTSATLQLVVEVDARNCNMCACPEEVIVVDFGTVEASPTQGKGTRSVQLPRNLCGFVRVDNMIKSATQPQRFGAPPIDDVTLQAGEGYSRTYTFIPAPGDYSLVQDTILVEHWISAENKACTTMVILRGQGCGPECRLVSARFTPTGERSWDYALERVRIYESGSGRICVENVGKCGTLVIGESHPATPGFTLTPPEVSIAPGSSACFEVEFEAADAVVWPNGHGQPAVIDHLLPVQIRNCGALQTVTVKLRVDTLPAQFSRCIYQWEQNGNYGYNFTPVEGKGEDHYDADPINNQDSDIAVMSVLTGVSADVRFKAGWKLVKSGVSEAQFNFDDMSKAQNGWTQSEYRSITSGAFNGPGAATLQFRGVYSVQVVRNGTTFYACIRVREISVDPDGKFKLCLDVLFPMIKE